jgi:hypothetical protein
VIASCQEVPRPRWLRAGAHGCCRQAARRQLVQRGGGPRGLHLAPASRVVPPAKRRLWRNAAPPELNHGFGKHWEGVILPGSGSQQYFCCFFLSVFLCCLLWADLACSGSRPATLLVAAWACAGWEPYQLGMLGEKHFRPPSALCPSLVGARGVRPGLEFWPATKGGGACCSVFSVLAFVWRSASQPHARVVASHQP